MSMTQQEAQQWLEVRYPQIRSRETGEYFPMGEIIQRRQVDGGNATVQGRILRGLLFPVTDEYRKEVEAHGPNPHIVGRTQNPDTVIDPTEQRKLAQITRAAQIQKRAEQRAKNNLTVQIAPAQTAAPVAPDPVTAAMATPSVVDPEPAPPAPPGLRSWPESGELLNQDKWWKKAKKDGNKRVCPHCGTGCYPKAELFTHCTEKDN